MAVAVRDEEVNPEIGHERLSVETAQKECAVAPISVNFHPFRIIDDACKANEREYVKALPVSHVQVCSIIPRTMLCPFTNSLSETFELDGDYVVLFRQAIRGPIPTRG